MPNELTVDMAHVSFWTFTCSGTKSKSDNNYFP